jgi:hypothetical protein
LPDLIGMSERARISEISPGTRNVGVYSTDICKNCGVTKARGAVSACALPLPAARRSSSKVERRVPINFVFVDEMEKIGLITFSTLMHGAVVSSHIQFINFEGKGLTMGFRNLANAISRSTTDEHKTHVKAALENRKKELQRALAAVERGLAQLKKPAKKAAKRRGKKR